MEGERARGRHREREIHQYCLIDKYINVRMYTDASVMRNTMGKLRGPHLNIIVRSSNNVGKTHSSKLKLVVNNI